MKHTKFSKLIALLLVLASLVSLSMPVFAAGGTVGDTSIQVHVKDEGQYTLELVKSGDRWYADASSLAKLAKAKMEYKGNKITFSSSDPYCVLHTVTSDTFIEHKGDKYVPLQESSVCLGLSFHVKEEIWAERWRTPAQLRAEITPVFTDERFQLSSIRDLAIFGAIETTSRLYAMLPFVGSGSIVGAVTGKDEQDRYRAVMTVIVSNGSGTLSDYLTDWADMDGSIKKYAKIIKNAKDISKKGGKAYNFLQSKGVNEKVLDALAYEYSPYEQDLGDYLDGYVTFADAVDLEYFLDLMSFYAAVQDMDESTFLAMKKVFENSNTPQIRKAMEYAISNRFGGGSWMVKDVYGGIIGNVIINQLNDKLEDYLAGGGKPGIGLGKIAFEELLHPGDISEAVIYMSIGASIQHDIEEYYWTHKNDKSEHITYDLRAIAMMHIKTAIVAYDYLSFDKDLAGTLAVASSTFQNKLDRIFSYAESEYAPDYDNQELIDHLETLDVVPIPSKPSDEPTPTPTKPVAATSGTCGDNLTWKYENGTLTISGTGEMDGYSYGDAPWFEFDEQIKTAIINEGVTSIGKASLYWLAEMTSVTIPASVTSIEKSAFFICSELKDVYYAGSEEDWEKITIEKNNSDLEEANIHFNGSTTPSTSDPADRKIARIEIYESLYIDSIVYNVKKYDEQDRLVSEAYCYNQLPGRLYEYNTAGESVRYSEFECGADGDRYVSEDTATGYRELWYDFGAVVTYETDLVERYKRGEIEVQFDTGIIGGREKDEAISYVLGTDWYNEDDVLIKSYDVQ